MKTLHYYLFIALFIIVSCNKDKQAPIITSLTFESNKTPPEFNRGDSLFFSFTAEDNKDFERYTVRIKPDDHNLNWNTNELYYFEESSATSVEVLKKGILLPANADTGYYEFTLLVEDKSSNIAETTQQIKIVGDSILPPSVLYQNAPTQFTAFTSNEVIELSGTINSSKQISSVQIFLVRTDDNLSNQEVSTYNSIVLLNEINLNQQSPYEFAGSITVGAPKDNNSPPHIIPTWNIGDCYLLVSANSNGIMGYGDRINIMVNN